MHQDGSYADYLVPPEMVTCWIALDDTRADAGTIEYARGSHRWPRVPARRSEFHAPDDWLAPVRDAVPNGEELELVPIVVRAGGCAFHHSLTFHGSGPNRATVERRALVSHLVSAETGATRRTSIRSIRATVGATISLDESFFPVVSDEGGRRTAWLDELPRANGSN